MARRDEQQPATNTVNATTVGNVVQAGSIHGGVHVHQQPFPVVMPATGPDRSSFGVGAKVVVGDRTYLIHDYLLGERSSSDHTVLRRQARCTQIAPVPDRSVIYGWFRQLEATERTRRSAGALTELTREADLLNRFARNRVRGVPQVSWSASNDRMSVLVTTWPAPRDGKPYDTLDTWLDGLGILDRSWLFSLCSGLAGLCATLGALHDAGVSHRFLTPDGIVSLRGSRLMLRDLGLATRPYEPGEGPAGYQTPEQRVRAAGRAGPATDAYQLAAVAYHLITGQVPHTTAALPLSRLTPDVPERIGSAIDAALATEAAGRPSIRSLGSQLKAGCNDIS